MDSLTQLALGAAVGEATLGRKLGYRAALWGAVCGTLPDLDSFVPYSDAVAEVTYHRSASHSLLVLAVLTPVMVWLINKVHPQTQLHRGQLMLMVYLVFATHVLLDGFTVYGTQLLWPLYVYPFSWSTIFIIDPAYTVPLISGVLCALMLSRQRLSGHYLNLAGLGLSACYLVWTVSAKMYIEHQLAQSLRAQGISYQRTLTTPAPFTTILWRTLVMSEGGYYDGFISVLDTDRNIDFTWYADEKNLLEGIDDHWPVQRLRWFTHGFYSVRRSGRDIIMTDLRMGLEPTYAFNYKVAEVSNPHPIPVPAAFYPGDGYRPEQFKWLRERIITPKK